MQVGVFYRVFYNPPRLHTSHVLNFEVPDSDPETFPIVEAARQKLEVLHPDAKTITIVAVSRDGPIIMDTDHV